MYKFAYPHLLSLLLIVVCWGVWEFKKKPSAIIFSGTSRLKSLVKTGSGFIAGIPVILRIIVLVLLVITVARPQKYSMSSDIISSGVDILLCLDASGSMQALDFMVDHKRVDRLAAVKFVVSDFIKKREFDRIGLVIFGENAFTQCPLTRDKGLLLNLVDNLKIGMAGDSTAIGLAAALGAKRLKSIKAKSKILILVTDGRNNAGDIDPLQAAEAAAALGIKIYTVGIGGFEPATFIVDTFFGKREIKRKVDLDENTLIAIAKKGNGLYFRASNSKKLKEIYDIIDKLEKTEIKVKEFFNYEELYRYFLFPALILLLIEIIIRSLFLRRLP